MYEVFGFQVAYDDVRWHFDHERQLAVESCRDYHYLISSPRFEVKNIVELHKLRQYLDLSCGIVKGEFSRGAEHLVKNGVMSWIRENPIGTGLGWVYTSICAVRLVNLVLLWRIFSEIDGDHSEFREEILRTVDAHIGFIYRLQSAHSSANNHLTVEIASIVMAQSIFRSRLTGKGEGLQEKALKQFLNLLKQQNDEDGKNRENSLGYQHHVLLTNFMVMSFAQRAGQVLPTWSIDRLSKMFQFYAACFDDYGNFFDYGDRDDSSVFGFGVLSAKEELYELLWVGHSAFGTRWPQFLEPRQSTLAQLWADEKRNAVEERVEPSGLVHLRHSGHGILNHTTATGRRLHLHFKAGEFGFLKIAAHSHCDLLSLYLTVDGEEIFVDPGTYCYRKDPMLRKYFVSRYAHNAVCFDGKSLYENYGPNHWRHDGSISAALNKVEELPHEFFISASLAGGKDYKAQRQVKISKDDGSLIITDRFSRTDNETASATILFTLGENVRIDPLLCEGWLMLTVADRVRIGLQSTALLRPVMALAREGNLGLHSSEFGVLDRVDSVLLSQQVVGEAFIKTKVRIDAIL